MLRTILVALAAASAFGCLVGHLKRDIPAPGGCDQCHRVSISSRWEVLVSPVHLGRDGGVPSDRDVVLAELQRLPVHRAVPAKRLEVFAATTPREAIGPPETGVQCFVCHRSPGGPHEGARGSFPHPWGAGPGERR